MPRLDEADNRETLRASNIVLMLSRIKLERADEVERVGNLVRRMFEILVTRSFDCIVNHNSGFLGSRYLDLACALAPANPECSFLAGCLLNLSGRQDLARPAMQYAAAAGMNHELIDRVISP